MIKNIMKMTTNIKNKILAIPAKADAIPPKPNNAATNDITKNTIAHPKRPIISPFESVDFADYI